jgi:AraC-like DNA-binding protein
MVAPDLLPHLRAAKDLIDRGYAEPLDLDVLARRAGCSRYHFLRAFDATYGQTPGRYLTRRRIERAQELLRTANLTVTEVSLLVGFSSLGAFCTRFREITGESPGGYRRRTVAAGGPPPVPGCFVLMWSNAGSSPPSNTAILEKPSDAAAS